MSDVSPLTFSDLALIDPVLKALNDVGYETPSPIQAQAIPPLMAGLDVLGQAQTGTGKTAAFACPLLSRIDLKRQQPQVLVLTPTRELAIQVAEAFQRYAARLKGFHVLPVYGGQEYSGQIRQLKRGVHVVVGTPGRIMDHMRRNTLKIDKLDCLVLDEADEMLRMGFIDDVEWILEQTPGTRQTALFSATLPEPIRRIAKRYLKQPQEITIKVRTSTADTIRQRFWMVSGLHKLDALTRILEAEPFDGMLIFVRTKIATLELSEKLLARGFMAAALNGDIAQKQREKTIEQLKFGKIDILVATDVAARGLDVERVSHVINYDIPYDTEAYVHRIGRTGRAGRSGEAILFVAPREKRLLHLIEKATKQKISMMELPSCKIINNQRIAKFVQGITDTLGSEDLEFYHPLLQQYQQENNVSMLEIAAALAKLAQGGKPLLLEDKPIKQVTRSRKNNKEKDVLRVKRDVPHRSSDRPHSNKFKSKRIKNREQMPTTEQFRIEVGHSHGVKPANIVGAIANEAGLDSQYIGRIEINDNYSVVDLPEGMPRQIFKDLKKVWVSGQQLKITRLSPPRSGIVGHKKTNRPSKKASANN